MTLRLNGTDLSRLDVIARLLDDFDVELTGQDDPRLIESATNDFLYLLQSMPALLAMARRCLDRELGLPNGAGWSAGSTRIVHDDGTVCIEAATRAYRGDLRLTPAQTRGLIDYLESMAEDAEIYERARPAGEDPSPEETAPAAVRPVRIAGAAGAREDQAA
ncbi:MAG: hypothetical protein AAF441_04290 [Pseudomonadota bacterium]